MELFNLRIIWYVCSFAKKNDCKLGNKATLRPCSLDVISEHCFNRVARKIIYLFRAVVFKLGFTLEISVGLQSYRCLAPTPRHSDLMIEGDMMSWITSAPKDTHHPILRSCECVTLRDKRDFVGVIKWGILSWGEDPEQSRWAPCHHNALTKGGGRITGANGSSGERRGRRFSALGFEDGGRSLKTSSTNGLWNLEWAESRLCLEPPEPLEAHPEPPALETHVRLLTSRIVKE